MKSSRSAALFLILFLCAVLAFPVPVHADTGPKPSLRVRFENLGEELCYGTLLSEKSSTGPQSAWDGNPETAVYRENPGYEYADFSYETWLAFAEYEDADGYYFLQVGWTVSETKEMAWTYYPPQNFKVLLYFPQEGVFVSSGVCERYAFDSYYTVNMEGLNIGSVSAGGEELSPYRSYDYTGEILSLLARIVITILIEIGVALLFGFRSASLSHRHQLHHAGHPQRFAHRRQLFFGAVDVPVFVCRAGNFCIYPGSGRVQHRHEKTFRTSAQNGRMYCVCACCQRPLL